MIKPPSLDETPPKILRNAKRYPWFKDCIGALDWTHIPIVVLTNQATLYRSGKKNECTQNVIAICSFHMRFTWIWPGWEGQHMIGGSFQKLRQDKMPISSSLNKEILFGRWGYPNTRGYLGQYKNCKCHLRDHRSKRRKGAQEIFNYSHSPLRNVIKRCFRVLKAHFPILKRMASIL